MRIMVIATHPDDEVFGCGGTIAWHAARGDEITVLVVSRGVPEIFPPEKIEETRSELRAAHRLLGVASAHFLDFPAPRLDTVPGHVLADAMRSEICSFGPKALYLPHWGDLHTDHQAVFKSALVAARPIDGCPVDRVLCYETVSETEWALPSGDQVFVPTVYVDISDFLDLKLKAASTYASQLKQPPHPRSLDNLAALARYRGATAGLASAEALVLVRDIIRWRPGS